MQKGRSGLQKTVSEIFEGVLVPEAGRTDSRCPPAILSLRHQISATLDRILAVRDHPGDRPRAS
jgi:hypothetical protein